MKNLVLSRNGTGLFICAKSGEVSSFRDELSRAHDLPDGFSLSHHYIFIYCVRVDILVKVLIFLTTN